MIHSTNKCIKNCKDVDKYEFNGICYPECPQYYTDTEGNHICKLDCPRFNMFFNYEKTDCISSIPKGFYLKDNENKIIDKCHENCEECDLGPTSDNNNCKTCKSTGTIYYDLGNCRESCINGHYTDENSIKKCKCTTNIQCKDCDKNGKCFTCNNESGYFQIEEANNEDNRFIKCEKDPEGYYLSENLYKKCNEKCKTCTGAGDDKCIECNTNYEFKNDFQNDTKCYEKCTYNYYYDQNNIYKCTDEDSCPDGMKFIETKRRCIDLCKNDNKYKFEFNGKCYEQCPDNTEISLEDNNKCEEIIEEEDECSLKFNEVNLGNDTLTAEELTELTTYYANKYGKSHNYITKLENEFFQIYIYNNILCLQNTSQEAKWTYFGEGYDSLLQDNHITYSIISLITNKTSNVSSYAFAHPQTGELLNLNRALNDEIHDEQEYIITKISHLDYRRREYIMFMIKNRLNVFDGSNEFYTNLCFHYESPNNKDIPMRDRVPYFYVDVTPCESRCTYQGIDYELLRFNCRCRFNGFGENNDENNNALVLSKKESVKVIKSVNIEVIKCFKDVFNKKYFKNCTGGIIILILSSCQIACMIFYFIRGFIKIEKHSYALFESFKKFSNKKSKKIAAPPKKRVGSVKEEKRNKNKISETPPSKFKLKSDLKNVSKKKDIKYQAKDDILLNTISKKKKDKNKNKSTKEDNNLIIDLKDSQAYEMNNAKTIEKMDKLDEKEYIGKLENEDFYNNMINEYVNPEYDENDFDDVIRNDKRTFFAFFIEKVFYNQIFIQTFYIKHIFNPLSLKIMALVLIIELYFVISGLFYTEAYLSERFHSNEKENFLSFIPNRINEIIYTAIISGIIRYFISYFFDNDDYLKRIFTKKLKFQSDKTLSKFIKNLKIKFIILIVISIIITIFSFIYISSFNIVYPYIKSEWIKTSVFILILMQIINLLSTLLGTCCRYLSFRVNNVKLFRLSLNLT